MKITPISSVSNSVQTADQGSRVDSLRSLKMITNATPLQGSDIDRGSAAQNLSILDNNEAPATVEATNQPLSPQFAELARQRRSLQREKRELEDLRKGVEAKSQDVNSIPLTRLKSEPLNVLLEAGVTYDQLTEAILAGQGNPEVNSLKAKLAILEESIDKKFTEKDTQAEKQVLAEMRRKALNLVAEGEAFEMVRETRSIPDVMELIEKTYRQSGEVLDVREACQLVEEFLFNKTQKLANLKKMQARLAAANPSQPQRQTGMRTLTNRDTASVPMSAKARAIAAYYGTLKK